MTTDFFKKLNFIINRLLAVFAFKALNERKAEVERERDEKISVIEKLNQKVKDKEVEFRISVKKNDQLVISIRLSCSCRKIVPHPFFFLFLTFFWLGCHLCLYESRRKFGFNKISI